MVRREREARPRAASQGSSACSAAQGPWSASDSIAPFACLFPSQADINSSTSEFEESLKADRERNKVPPEPPAKAAAAGAPGQRGARRRGAESPHAGGGPPPDYLSLPRPAPRPRARDPCAQRDMEALAEFEAQAARDLNNNLFFQASSATPPLAAKGAPRAPLKAALPPRAQTLYKPTVTGKRKSRKKLSPEEQKKLAAAEARSLPPSLPPAPPAGGPGRPARLTTGAEVVARRARPGRRRLASSGSSPRRSRGLRRSTSRTSASQGRSCSSQR